MGELDSGQGIGVFKEDASRNIKEERQTTVYNQQGHFQAPEDAIRNECSFP